MNTTIVCCHKANKQMRMVSCCKKILNTDSWRSPLFMTILTNRPFDNSAICSFGKFHNSYCVMMLFISKNFFYLFNNRFGTLRCALCHYFFLVRI